MISVADKKPRISARLREWLENTTPRRPLVLFRIFFASTWLLYDILDLVFNGTQNSFWNINAPTLHVQIHTIQVVLLVCQVGLLIGWKHSVFALAAVVARAFEAKIFPLNDFHYYCVTALLLSQCDCGWKPKNKPPSTVAAWPRDVLLLQTAWIYFSSAFMKLSPPFLSGGDLYVRQNYMATNLNWSYPAFYRAWIAHLPANAFLAWLSVIAETSLAVLLFTWWKFPRWRNRVRTPTVGLVLGIHLFGAFFLNVFFFGASLIAQVFFLTDNRSRKL